MIEWQFLSFKALSGVQVYELLKLRSRVFVVEQNCVFLDMDGLDQKCFHLLGYQDNVLIACTRIVPKGVSYPDYASIGRVVIAPEARGKKYGYELMQQSVEMLHNLYGKVPIKIGAQLYLKTFYESLGFLQSGLVYLEDGIEHIPMIRSVSFK